ncbi:hypothetical protein [Ammoniphilus sp. 3BR4]|uniref:hypothetical protein n=1 Tax=Ammoniphilus sp. 3BR4 TaxID=3158265 RepID=UPI00346639BA
MMQKPYRRHNPSRWCINVCTNSISKATVGEFLKEVAPFLRAGIALLFLFTFLNISAPVWALVFGALLAKFIENDK